ncbi:MAG: hypothetical protein P4L45_02340 [Ignavibacteriaceae bacterium]|nr:hypothetical protein [Ignavibacteriaceae bacterium]
MDENTLRIVASNLTAAYYSVNKAESEQEIDTLTQDKFLPSKVIIRTYRAFLSELYWEEDKIQTQLAKLRQTPPLSSSLE